MRRHDIVRVPSSSRLTANRELFAIEDVEPKRRSSSTSNFASIAMTTARCNGPSMPFDNSRTLLVCLIVVFARNLPPSRDRIFDEHRQRNRAVGNPIQRGSTATSAMKEDVAHELFARIPRIATEHRQISRMK